MSAFNLHDTIKDCIDKLPVPSDKNVEIHILSEDYIILTADKMHIANIISNLLENSVKYSGNSVTVDIDYRESDNETVSITIRDNGFGISKTDSQFVFDKFFRGISASDNGIPGMGLGLSYVKQLVQAHRGSISMESEEGAGTLFTIKLPQ